MLKEQFLKMLINNHSIVFVRSSILELFLKKAFFKKFRTFRKWMQIRLNEILKITFQNIAFSRLLIVSAIGLKELENKLELFF